MKTINFRNIFGVAAVSSASITALVGIFLLLTSTRGRQSSDTFITIYSLCALSIFTLAGFCASLVKERYPVISILGMITSIIAFLCAVSFVYVRFQMEYYEMQNEYDYQTTAFVGKFAFFFASASFATGYISILLTTLRGYSCVLNNFIYATIGLLSLLWTVSQVIMLTNGQIMEHIYQFVGSVYLLSLLGGVWIFVLSRMGVAEPKTGQDEMFKEV